MQGFRDCTGHMWMVSVNPASNRRAVAIADYDLFGVGVGEALGALIESPVLSALVLYAICKPEAEAKQISEEDFYCRLNGCIDGAMSALLGAIIDFFPNPRRDALRSALRSAMEEIGRAAISAEAEIAAKRSGSQQSGSGGSSTAAPESSA